MQVSLSLLQQFLLVLLRFVVGWHLFYQGLGKLWIVGWSAKGYLENASGPLDNVFQALADRPGLMSLADFAVVWGLLLSGLLLMLGLFSRLAALAGMFALQRMRGYSWRSGGISSRLTRLKNRVQTWRARPTPINDDKAAPLSGEVLPPERTAYKRRA